MEQIKSSSSAWIKSADRWYDGFVSQRGYGEFSVSPIQAGAVHNYIKGQAEHHGREDYQAEFRRFCERNGRAVDERYAWD